ncbi:galactose-proton symporter [Escherichia coli]|uniref:Galactose-proton symporter n=1 Tax=Escherichia coli TaxID=562 RepID=A0A377D8M3_ECOLX|nr:galactose-proton symporter [Escherichia coli]
MPDAKKQGRSNKAMTFFVCFLAALAGLLFGLDIGVIAGALPFIADEFQITSHTQEWVVSSMMFGAAVGAVGSGWLSFKLGRKKSLMIGAILFVAGSLFSAAAPNVEVLILSPRSAGAGGGCGLLYRTTVPVRNCAGKNSRQYDLDVSVDDHYRDPRCLSF